MRSVLAGTNRSMGGIQVIQGLSGKAMPLAINQAERARGMLGDAVTGDPTSPAMAAFGRRTVGMVVFGSLILGGLGWLIYRTYSLEMAR